ncbi:hypothetical protein P7C70_g7938, partial [Phenoliferia sp. Uapishka_3]
MSLPPKSPSSLSPITEEDHNPSSSSSTALPTSLTSVSTKANEALTSSLSPSTSSIPLSLSRPNLYSSTSRPAGKDSIRASCDAPNAKEPACSQSNPKGVTRGLDGIAGFNEISTSESGGGLSLLDGSSRKRTGDGEEQLEAFGIKQQDCGGNGSLNGSIPQFKLQTFRGKKVTEFLRAYEMNFSSRGLGSTMMAQRLPLHVKSNLFEIVSGMPGYKTQDWKLLKKSMRETFGDEERFKYSLTDLRLFVKEKRQRGQSKNLSNISKLYLQFREISSYLIRTGVIGPQEESRRFLKLLPKSVVDTIYKRREEREFFRRGKDNVDEDEDETVLPGIQDILREIRSILAIDARRGNFSKCHRRRQQSFSDTGSDSESEGSFSNDLDSSSWSSEEEEMTHQHKRSAPSPTHSKPTDIPRPRTLRHYFGNAPDAQLKKHESEAEDDDPIMETLLTGVRDLQIAVDELVLQQPVNYCTAPGIPTPREKVTHLSRKRKRFRKPNFWIPDRDTPKISVPEPPPFNGYTYNNHAMLLEGNRPLKKAIPRTVSPKQQPQNVSVPDAHADPFDDYTYRCNSMTLDSNSFSSSLPSSAVRKPTTKERQVSTYQLNSEKVFTYEVGSMRYEGVTPKASDTKTMSGTSAEKSKQWPADSTYNNSRVVCFWCNGEDGRHEMRHCRDLVRALDEGCVWKDQHGKIRYGNVHIPAQRHPRGMRGWVHSRQFREAPPEILDVSSLSEMFGRQQEKDRTNHSSNSTLPSKKEQKSEGLKSLAIPQHFAVPQKHVTPDMTRVFQQRRGAGKERTVSVTSTQLERPGQQPSIPSVEANQKVSRLKECIQRTSPPRRKTSCERPNYSETVRKDPATKEGKVPLACSSETKESPSLTNEIPFTKPLRRAPGVDVTPKVGNPKLWNEPDDQLPTLPPEWLKENSPGIEPTPATNPATRTPLQTLESDEARASLSNETFRRVVREETHTELINNKSDQRQVGNKTYNGTVSDQVVVPEVHDVICNKRISKNGSRIYQLTSNTGLEQESSDVKLTGERLGDVSINNQTGDKQRGNAEISNSTLQAIERNHNPHKYYEPRKSGGKVNSALIVKEECKVPLTTHLPEICKVQNIEAETEHESWSKIYDQQLPFALTEWRKETLPIPRSNLATNPAGKGGARRRSLATAGKGKVERHQHSDVKVQAQNIPTTSHSDDMDKLGDVKTLAPRCEESSSFECATVNKACDKRVSNYPCKGKISDDTFQVNLISYNDENKFSGETGGTARVSYPDNQYEHEGHNKTCKKQISDRTLDPGLKEGTYEAEIKGDQVETCEEWIDQPSASGFSNEPCGRKISKELIEILRA